MLGFIENFSTNHEQLRTSGKWRFFLLMRNKYMQITQQKQPKCDQQRDWAKQGKNFSIFASIFLSHFFLRAPLWTSFGFSWFPYFRLCPDLIQPNGLQMKKIEIFYPNFWITIYLFSYCSVLFFSFSLLYQNSSERCNFIEKNSAEYQVEKNVCAPKRKQTSFSFSVFFVCPRLWSSVERGGRKWLCEKKRSGALLLMNKVTCCVTLPRRLWNVLWPRILSSRKGRQKNIKEKCVAIDVFVRACYLKYAELKLTWKKLNFEWRSFCETFFPTMLQYIIWNGLCSL